MLKTEKEKSFPAAFENWKPHSQIPIRIDLSEMSINGTPLRNSLSALECFGRPEHSALAPDTYEYKSSGLYFHMDRTNNTELVGCYLIDIATVYGNHWKACALSVTDANGNWQEITSRCSETQIRTWYPNATTYGNPAHDLILIIDDSKFKLKFEFQGGVSHIYNVRINLKPKRK